IGVALLTALLPRMSRAAAAGDIRRLVGDLSLGSRMTAVGLIPITAAYIALGPAITVMIFAHGRSSIEGAHATGLVLAWSAFGLLPFALTLLQLRVFYAMKDARTPTLINVVMVAARVLLCVIAAEALPARHVVIGLAVANSLSFVVGAIVGDVLLRKRIGYLDSARFLRTVARLTIAATVGGVAAWLVLNMITGQIGYGRGGATASAVLGCLVGGVVALVTASRLHIEDLNTVVASVRKQLGR
ncbi:MAG TPA: lipid II flippase MurJ, partial [Mycobacteriales bacterium]|nr:lipid II flippase MurJ [Mycobacteriales bacterium]